MITVLIIAALFIQFAGVYALIIRVKHAQDAGSRPAIPVNRRGQQAYYDAFAKTPDKRSRGNLVA